jgi:hypothetical protein
MKEHKLRVLEKRLRTKIFELRSNMTVTTGDWRKLRNQELHYDYSSEHIITEAWCVARIGKKINAWKVLTKNVKDIFHVGNLQTDGG